MSIAKVPINKVAYYVEYTTEAGEHPGELLGLGAERVRILGVADALIAKNLALGLSPDGKEHRIQLAAIRKDRKHTAGWDECMSMPKDVSVLWALIDEWKEPIERCQKVAVQTYIDHQQENTAFTRRGSGGKRQEPCELVFLAVNHYTSRNNDPQLHTHIFRLNVAARADGTWGTIVSKHIYDHQTAARAVYLATLARELKRKIGVTIEGVELKPFQPGEAFNVAGVPAELRQLMSSRRAEILTAKARFGFTTARGGDIAALATRNAKSHLPEAFLRKQWQAMAAAIGVDVPEMKAAVLRGGVNQSETPAEQVSQKRPAVAEGGSASPAPSNVVPIRAKEQATDAPKAGTAAGPAADAPPKSLQTPQTRSDEGPSPELAASILQSVTRSAIAASLPNPMVDKLIDHVLDEFDRKNRIDRTKTFAARTAEARKALPRLLDDAEKLQAVEHHVIDAGQIETGTAGPLTSRQADTALVELLSKSRAVACVEARPGVDTNLFVAAMAHQYKLAGVKVKALTASQTAASELQTATGLPTHTVGQVIHRLSTSSLDKPWHHTKQIVRAAFKMWTTKFDGWQMDDSTVVVITNAQSLRTTDLREIVARAKTAGSKVVLVGSSEQLPRREPHNAFAEVIRKVGAVKLSEPAQQTQEWMSDALRQAARGDIRGAMSQYVMADRLHLAPDQRSATIELVNHWKSLPKSQQQDGKTLIVGDSARDIRLLNKLAQSTRRESGELGFLMRQRVDGAWVYKGDRMLFRISSKHYGFRAGDFGTIEGIGLSSMTLRLDRESSFLGVKYHARVKVPKSLYRGLTMGYAVTAADAQGMTCEQALVLPRAGGNDLRGLAVQLSRAREDTRIFTTTRSVGEDIEAISDGVRQQTQKEAQRQPVPAESPEIAEANQEARKKEKQERMQQQSMQQRQGQKI